MIRAWEGPDMRAKQWGWGPLLAGFDGHKTEETEQVAGTRPAAPGRWAAVRLSAGRDR